ncbi:DUF2887 domain-containing protein [Lamprobacter modestohalophilus]|uniref:DUF2887 domain-containing protein n=1 Tax=Lamprobacter modestohalophilus TaxID=1064514 RepID=UPI002ADEB982|nr:DUF2887 domain-containing protein [Lamprobacter modestohalophilus]MEA1051579.1 DUF2887 domain-containing protein [Lamprobacter modestohalophilus]
MKTDHPIDLFLRSGPEAFRVLTGGLQLEGAYRVCSLTLKSLERRLDGLVEPDGHAGPAYVVECQAQPLDKSLAKVDALVRRKVFRNRSRAIQEAVLEKLERLERNRLAEECAKLDPAFERAMADEALSAELDAWPKY